MAIDETVLASSDRGPIISVLSGLSGKPEAWLSADHPFKDGQLPRTWAGVNAVPDEKRIETVAVSGPLHCMDGWAYASRSLSSLLAGDGHAARHLAYYAQLRAALSILASNGIGIFNSINFVVKSDNTTARLDPSSNANKGLGTHIIAWDALKSLATTQVRSVELLGMIRIRGNRLSDIIEFVWPGYSGQAVAQDLIKAFGVDLERGKTDHKFRNISSYAPSAFNAVDADTKEAIEFLLELWPLFEPSSGPGFDALDRYLLRSALWKQHESIHEGDPLAGGALSTASTKLPPEILALTSQEFLLNSTIVEPRFLTLARSVADPAQPREMIARAFLLLRLALAFTHANLSDAGLAPGGGNLREWLDGLASARGFFCHSAPTEVMSDLWFDVQIALEELEEKKTPDPISLHQLLSRRPIGMPTISEAERIGFWSLSA